MKLKIKIVDAPGVRGGKAIVLCDEGGEMLPMQVETEVHNGAGGMGRITATFHIDGEQVAFD